MSKTRLAIIEIAYDPAHGKAGAVEDAIDEAVEALFMRLTDGLIEAGQTATRVLCDGSVRT